MASDVRALIQAGEWDAALRLARSQVTAAPDSPLAHYELGLALLVSGDHAQAVEALTFAADAMPDHAPCQANLGVACQRAGDAPRALVHLSNAIRLDPDNLDAVFNKACVALELEDGPEALTLFSRLLARAPDNPEWLCGQADALRICGRWQQALALYRSVMVAAPTLARAWQNGAMIALQFGLLDDALAMSEQAVALQPDNAQVHQNLGDCLLQMERIDDAMAAYADAYERDSEKADLCVAIGRVFKEVGEPDEAMSWCLKARALAPEDIGATCLQGALLIQSESLDDAAALLQPALAEHPDSVPLNLVLADYHWESGDAGEALQRLAEVRRLQPERLQVLTRMAGILNSSGDTDAALSLYREALAVNPRFPPALSGLAVSRKGVLSEEQVATMEALLAQGVGLRSGQRASIASGLAHHYDGLKLPQQAAQHSRDANQAQWSFRSKRDWDYEPVRQEDYISTLIEVFDSDHFERVRDWGSDSVMPVFIVGMPRSGTTLTEQILARHSAVLGVGERPLAMQSFTAFVGGRFGPATRQQFLDRLAPDSVLDLANQYLAKLQQLLEASGKRGARLVVDKMPDNYALVGWLLTLFPNARIIHAGRDVRDVAVSCWLTQFAAIPWACKEDHIVHRIGQYRRIMRHWQTALGDRLYDSHYERLVADQDTETRRLLTCLGIPFEPECLSFYDSDRLVRTASITQVREPIYRQSVAKWERYRPFLPDLIEPLMGPDPLIRD